MLKYRNLFRFQLKGNTIDENTSIPELRRTTEQSSKAMGKMPAGLEATALTINGLPAHRLIPSQGPADKVILYFHGGGYVIGSSGSHLPIVAKVVQSSGIGALIPDYRLAPENLTVHIL
jgi:acetyl esterase/lipase